MIRVSDVGFTIINVASVNIYVSLASQGVTYSKTANWARIIGHSVHNYLRGNRIG